MNRNIRNLAIAILPSLVLPIETQFPFSYYAPLPPGVYSCPANGCHFYSSMSPVIFLGDYFFWLAATFGVITLIDRTIFRSIGTQHVRPELSKTSSLKRDVSIFVVLQLIVALSVFGIILPTNLQHTSSVSSSVSTSYYSTLSNTNATNATFSSSEITNSTICMVAVEGNGVYLRIVSDSSNDSLSGINVLAIPESNSCPGSFIPYSFEQTSNASGWVSLNFPNLQANYYYQVLIDYNGKNYSFVLPQGPLETTLALVSLPSGNLKIQLCVTDYGPTRLSCQPYVNETYTFTGSITSSVTHG